MKLPEQITFGELKSIPPFDRVKDALMVAPGPMGQMMDRVRIDRCPAGWSEAGIRFGLEKLACALDRDQVLYPVYEKDECASSPEKSAVNLLYFPPETDPEGKPFVVICPGGSYLAVCAAAEGFPVAGRLAELGYPVFILEYRVGKAPVLPAALDDLAAAIRWIFQKKESFGISGAYVVGGFSAGGHLAALWGTDSAGYRHYGIAKPEALLLGYPLIQTDKADSPETEAALSILQDQNTEKEDYSILLHTDGFPPCYLVRCKDDEVLSGQHALSLKASLDKLGIPCDLEEGERGGHGFGDGRGTSVEGWVDRAHRFLQQLPARRWSISAPHNEDESMLSGFLKAANTAGLDLHAICVRRKNEQVCSHHIWSPTPEQIESCTKSVVSLAAGIAIGEGLLSLDDRLVDLFPEYAPQMEEDLWNEVQIRHLLTMTTGFASDPLAMNVRNRIREDWVGCCMRQPLMNKPGTRFQYHNASAHLVARAIQRRTGCTLKDWLIPRLFDPLDIPNPQWYVDPQGFTYGGDGLHLTVEQMARIGQLCLSGGVWDNRQLVPAWYVQEATQKQTDNRGNGLTYHRDDTAGYGYFFWIADEPGVFYASGSGGKMIYCFRKQDTVVAVTAHLEPFYQYQLLLDLVREHLLIPTKLADNAKMTGENLV